MDDVTRTPDRRQPALPLDLEEATPLPFDDEADRPLDLLLTARGRRAVGASDLPALEVVPDPDAGAAASSSAPLDGAAGGSRLLAGEEDPSDTRPSQARALRRAGRATAEIAERLQVDELLVRAWIADVSPAAARGHQRVARQRGASATRAASLADRGPRDRSRADRSRADRGHADPEGAERRLEEHRTGFELARAAAREEARRSFLQDPDFAAVVGILSGIAEFDPHAVTLTTATPALVTRVIGWIRQRLDVEPGRVRVVLRIGPRVAGDLAAHRWAKHLEVDRSRVAVASWRSAPAADAEQVLVRLADPSAAATLAGWCDALLEPSGTGPADVAF